MKRQQNLIERQISHQKLKSKCIMSGWEDVKKYPSLDSSEPLGLWRVASHRVEDVDQHQEQGHQQGHSTCKFQIEVWLMGQNTDYGHQQGPLYKTTT